MTDVQQAVPVAGEAPGEGWSDDWKASGRYVRCLNSAASRLARYRSTC
jgi:hypothetical protein